MNRRRMAAIVALFALTASGCGSGGGGGSSQGGDGEAGTLQLWAYEGYQDFLPKLIEGFEAKYPKIKVELTNVPEEQYVTKVDTALAAKQPPDLGFIYERRWLKQDKFVPVDDIVKSENIDLSTWASGVISKDPNGEAACSYEGKTYCLGSYTGTALMFYNKDMFDKAGMTPPAPWPGMTLEEYATTACQLRDKIGGGVYGTAHGDPVTWLPWEVHVSSDGKKAEGVANSANTARDYEIIAKMFRDKCAPSLNVLDPWQQGVDFFAQKKLAMVITDFQSLAKIEKAGVNYGVTAPPHPEGVEPYFSEWTDGIGVFKDGKNVAAAKKFIAFQATEGQKLRVQKTGDMPVSVAKAKEFNWAADQLGRQQALEILPHARPATFIPARWDTVTPLFDSLGAIIDGKPAQQVLDDAVPKYQNNLDKAWKTWDKS
ncbi:MAG TPA: sugar ABC transporter substrate-binding protein [Micromonosporaceae bacterium]